MLREEGIVVKQTLLARAALAHDVAQPGQQQTAALDTEGSQQGPRALLAPGLGAHRTTALSSRHLAAF